jgi:uncharacterized protein YbbC (DUF1343 family)
LTLARSYAQLRVQARAVSLCRKERKDLAVLDDKPVPDNGMEIREVLVVGTVLQEPSFDHNDTEVAATREDAVLRER